MSQAPENLYNIESAEQFRQLLSADLERISLLNFWATWAEPCAKMNEVVSELARTNPRLLVLQIEADKESNEEIADSFTIESVPAFLILKGHNLLSRIDGADAPALTNAVRAHAQQAPQSLAKSDKTPEAPEQEETTEQLNDRMRKLMNQSKVVLFMKGSPDAPRCGFSRQTVALLQEKNVEFTHFDILKDEKVRAGLKVLNDWPTFPQIIVNGELVGGLDVLKESMESGEFQELVNA
ncbi:monothiol glutaredoxin [Ceratobasidium sp. AG-Ba]|nr:monothiol glutaredoxin [Ceratobasidium sp. AG-Ba]